MLKVFIFQLASDRHAGLTCVLSLPTTHATQSDYNLDLTKLDLTRYTWITELHGEFLDCLLMKNL